MTEETLGIFRSLVRVEIRLWTIVDRSVRKHCHVSLAWIEVMRVVADVPDCRVIDIAATLGITVGGTSKLVDRIESSGWCRREPHTMDRRSSVIRLTPGGEDLLVRTETVAATCLREYLADAATLAAPLAAIFAALSADHASGDWAPAKPHPGSSGHDPFK